MKPVWWTIAVSVLFWVAVTACLGARTGVDVLIGMLGPLAAASVTWMLTERTFHRNPERLTSLMVLAFGGKMVFFGTYVVVVLTALPLDPVPFVVSFTGYFIALHLVEALCLRRLFGHNGGAPLAVAS